jgi:Ca2+-binding EF-hand superfamily protein
MMLDELEAGVSAGEARTGFQDIDSNDDGLIDFKEFVAWWTEE